jgi:hypothetical protein
MALALMIKNSPKTKSVRTSNKNEMIFWQNFGKKSAKNKKGASVLHANPLKSLVGRIGIEPITY